MLLQQRDVRLFFWFCCCCCYMHATVYKLIDRSYNSKELCFFASFSRTTKYLRIQQHIFVRLPNYYYT